MEIKSITAIKRPPQEMQLSVVGLPFSTRQMKSHRAATTHS
jgi:hypothetical protein